MSKRDGFPARRLFACVLAVCAGMFFLAAPGAFAQPGAPVRPGSPARPGSSARQAVPARQAAGTASGPSYGLGAMAAFDQLPDLRVQQRMGHLSSVAPDLSNQDWDHYLYTDSDGGRVILDNQGPGVITRLHLTLASGASANTTYVKVYLDGSSTPQIDDTMANLAAGTKAPFLSPLVEDATVGSGGYTYYLPIPYAKSARVSLSGPGSIYWQTDWQSFPPGTPIQTWTGSEDSSQVRALWDNAGTYPDPQAGDVSQSGTTSLPGDGQSTVLADLSGPQEITAIKLKIPGVGPTRGASASILDDTHLRIYWDDEATPSVDAPLGSFFGMGYFGAAPTRDVAMGMLDDGTMYSYFPMPFQHDARIELVNEMTGSGDQPIGGVTYTITHRPYAGSFADVGYFRTAWTPQTVPPAPGPGQPNPDPVRWLNVSGAGQVVGIVESRYSSPVPGRTDRDLGFLEGNVHMFVDGSKTPAWRDNGTEDTFDGGYYFNQGPVENANSGDNIKTSNSVAAYRTFIGDAVPFRDHITIDDQPGGIPPATGPNVASYQYYTTDFPLVFYYSQTPRMTQTDSFSVSDATAAAQHHYQATGQASPYSLTSTYDSYLHPPQVTAQVNAQQGSSQFTLGISPQNQGVVLRRTYDQAHGGQAADVYVDGAYAGRWSQAYANNVSRWAQDDYTLPAASTAGKNSITVQLRWVPGSPAWTEAAYAAYSIEPPPASGQFHVSPPAGNIAATLDPPPTLTDGTPGTVTGTFYNATSAPLGNVRYQLTGAPAGWQVTPASPQPAEVAAHQAVRLTWHVTVPDGTPASEPALTLQTSYDTAAGPATAQSATQITQSLPPVQITSFTVTPQTVQPGQQATFQVHLHNRGPVPLSGDLTLSGPSGWTITPATQPYSLAPGADQTLTATTTNPGIQGKYLTFTASTTYAGTYPGDQAHATLFTPGGAQAYCSAPGSGVVCTFDSQGNLGNMYGCAAAQYNSPNQPVAETINGCGGRVWLHQYPYPQYVGNVGWAYCISPGATADIPAGNQAAQNIQVTTNTSAC